MQRRRWLLTSLKAAALGFLSERLAPAQEQLDPVKIMPETHKLIFENEFVRVIESRVPAGGVEPRHSHPHCVTVSLAEVDAKSKTFPDGKTTRTHSDFGAVKGSEATIHEVKNLGKTASHNIRVELKH